MSALGSLEAAARRALPSAIVPGVALIAPLWLIPTLIPTAGAQAVPDAAAALATDPSGTLALLQAALSLGPSGALLAAAYLIGRWQPRVVVEVALDDAAQRALLRHARILSAGDDARTDDPTPEVPADPAPKRGPAGRKGAN